MEEKQALIKMNDSHRTPNRKDAKPGAQQESEDSPPLPAPDRRRLRKQEHESDHMKKVFAALAKNTQKQLREQGEKHAMVIATMKRSKLDAHNILTTKTTPAQTMNDHITTAHFTAMTKPSETLFNGTP
jgi:hypothetical protein